MKNIYSYILLVVTLIFGTIYGFSTVKIPDSFARRGALPSLDEWRGNRVRAAVNHN